MKKANNKLLYLIELKREKIQTMMRIVLKNNTKSLHQQEVALEVVVVELKEHQMIDMKIMIMFTDDDLISLKVY